jgi:hypothetical protein
MCVTSVIFKPLPKLSNRPLGENSANLVTLSKPSVHEPGLPDGLF